MDNIDTFIKLLSKKTPFAFSRFNDGEILAMAQESGFTARGDQEINKFLKENLVRCAKHEQKNYWKGVPCGTCFPKHREIADSIIGDKYKYRCAATVFTNNNWRYFIKHFPEVIKDREIVFISGNDQNPSKLWFLSVMTKLHVSMPNKNSFRYYEIVRDNKELLESFVPGKVILLSCGPLSRVLCCDWFQEHKECTFIDIGSTFDPFTRNVWHRCHLGDLPPCPECNNV